MWCAHYLLIDETERGKVNNNTQTVAKINGEENLDWLRVFFIFSLSLCHTSLEWNNESKNEITDINVHTISACGYYCGMPCLRVLGQSEKHKYIEFEIDSNRLDKNNIGKVFLFYLYFCFQIRLFRKLKRIFLLFFLSGLSSSDVDWLLFLFSEKEKENAHWISSAFAIEM